MICKKCNREFADDSAFCPYCGAPVEKEAVNAIPNANTVFDAAPQNAAPQTPPPAPAQPGNGQGKAIAGMVLGIVGVVLGILSTVFSLLGLPVAIVGLVLSVNGGKALKASGQPSGIATAGLVIGIIAVVFTAITFFTCGLCTLCMIGAATSEALLW